MKEDEAEEKISPEGNREEPVEEYPGDALRKSSAIEQIDDSQLPQSVKELFRK
jgi:hypothetical protein